MGSPPGRPHPQGETPYYQGVIRGGLLPLFTQLINLFLGFPTGDTLLLVVRLANTAGTFVTYDRICHKMIIKITYLL